MRILRLRERGLAVGWMNLKVNRGSFGGWIWRLDLEVCRFEKFGGLEVGFGGLEVGCGGLEVGFGGLEVG